MSNCECECVYECAVNVCVCVCVRTQLSKGKLAAWRIQNLHGAAIGNHSHKSHKHNFS